MRLIIRLLALAVALCIVRGCAHIQSAPAPFPRTVRPQPVAGHYVLHWGVRYHMTLAAGGQYSAVSPCGTEVWRGTWKIEGGSLHVSETRHQDCPPDCHWSLPYPSDRIERIGGRQR